MHTYIHIYVYIDYVHNGRAADVMCCFPGKMHVLRSRPDSCRKDPTQPPSHQNYVTHWWDGSQIYGSDKETQMRVRSYSDGKLKVDDYGFLPVDTITNIDITGL